MKVPIVCTALNGGLLGPLGARPSPEEEWGVLPLRFLSESFRFFFGRIFCEKFCENGKLYVTLQRLRRGAPRLGTTIVLWCNGSTTVFGSVCLGSNPGKTTIREEGNLKAAWPNGFFLLFYRRVVSEFYTGLSRGVYGTISGYGLLFVPTPPHPSIWLVYLCANFAPIAPRQASKGALKGPKFGQNATNKLN